MFSARFLTAKEAFDAGIVQFLANRDDIDQEVFDYAKRIAANAPLTVKAAKAAINVFEQGGMKEEVQDVRKLITACFNSADYREGRRAFAEKRSPAFTGS